MNKFWEWMENKEYGHDHELLVRCRMTDCENGFDDHVPSKQMLIGYMMDFLDEMGSMYDVNRIIEMGSKTEQRYAWLESKIKEIDNG